jgi:hypothetical protein
LTRPDDDRRLLARFRNRDRAAFDTLYERYAGRLLAFALHLTVAAGRTRKTWFRRRSWRRTGARTDFAAARGC